ncbi:MAG: hypothetical protein MUF04_07395 [Akkermansiaceae bacterium]|nr:hypothetical protein [Akkermansiaceae bacterium]
MQHPFSFPSIRTAVAGLLLMLCASAARSPAADAPDELAAGFRNPGIEARPRAYWNWLNGDVSPSELTRDMEEAKAKGLGGLDMWDTEAMRNPDGFVPAGPPFMGPESVAAMQHCIREARRLGLDLGLITSSGWNAGGPWVPPALASKNLFVAEEVVRGPGEIRRKLPFPEVPAKCPKNPDGTPKWWLDVAVLAWPDTPDKMSPDPSQVLDLTAKAEGGELRWTAPAGTWRVARFVCTNNGQQLIAASPNSKGPFIDFLDPEATRFHFEYIIRKLGLQRGGDPAPLRYLALDSMELYPGIQWTPEFPKWFARHHGYSPRPWLPVLAGWTVIDAETNARFKYDYQKTVSDLLIFSHYTTGSKVCAEYGLELCAEAGGPGPPIWDTCPVDALKALGNVHLPRGEFWIQSPRDIFLIKEIASAANIYGRRYVDAESWTTWRRWADSPFARKRLVDRAFCEGLNRITYHGFANSPESFGHPGRTYHAGVDMNPRVVWWSKARPFMDYLARCCHLLQQGRFVADVAYFYGDQAPNFWPPLARVPEKPLLPGLGAGYDYDVVNADVILNHMSVKDGRIVLKSGMSYRVLVLRDQDHMPLEVLRKLDQLVREGATVIGPKPVKVPGLHEHEARTAGLRRIADRMWGADAGANPHGKGRVIHGMSAREWLESQATGADFTSMDAALIESLDFIHRRTADRDIYFVRNKTGQPLGADCRFRVSGRTPQFWDPATGDITGAPGFQPVDGGTRVRLDLPPGGSIFVVFSDHPVPAASSADRDVAGNPASHLLDGGWTVAFDPTWGAPARVELPALISWTDHPDAGVKYYSGTGTYTRTLEVPADWPGEGRRVWLDLGEVGELAEVFVNGRSAGILWKPPFQADITALVRPGANDLKIEVMNLWVNRLIGDESLPPEQRLTRTNIRLGDGSRQRLGWELQPSGLLGPVRLLAAPAAPRSP